MATDEPKPIFKYGKNAHGEQVAEGYYAIGPDGHLVLITGKLKVGWRVATQADITASEQAAAEKAAVEPEQREHAEGDVGAHVAELEHEMRELTVETNEAIGALEQRIGALEKPPSAQAPAPTAAAPAHETKPA